MRQEGANKADAEQVQKSEEILEQLKYVVDNASGLRNRIHAACERVGVQFDPSEAQPDQPPCFGSLNQIQQELSKLSSIVAVGHEHMIDLERFI